MDDRLLYEGYYQEALAEPMKFIRHDVNAHDDPALLELCLENGHGFYGLYWLLVEGITAREGHYYDLATATGEFALRRDLSALGEVDAGQCIAFVEALAGKGLIDAESWRANRRVMIERVLRDADTYAKGVASKKMGAAKANRRKSA